jgi:hypothetical protein
VRGVIFEFEIEVIYKKLYRKCKLQMLLEENDLCEYMRKKSLHLLIRNYFFLMLRSPRQRITLD